jgi:hypothetical protein
VIEQESNRMCNIYTWEYVKGYNFTIHIRNIILPRPYFHPQTKTGNCFPSFHVLQVNWLPSNIDSTFVQKVKQVTILVSLLVWFHFLNTHWISGKVLTEILLIFQKRKCLFSVQISKGVADMTGCIYPGDNLLLRWAWKHFN